MKFVLRIIIIGVACYLAGLIFPWWSILFVCFIVGFLMNGNDINVFLSGFIGAGVLWLGQSWQQHIRNKGLIANQITELFGYSDPITFVIYSALIGAILGGLSGMTGGSLRNIYIKEKKKRMYS